MPPCEADYLIQYLWDAGPTIDNVMGSAPLSHADIVAWRSNTGIDLQPWESSFLKSLSRDYLTQLQKSESPACPAPYAGVAERRASVAKKIDELFG